DFEVLHRNTGALAKILSLKNELIRAGETACRGEIEELEEQLRIAEQQTPADLRELRQIYAMALIEELPENPASVSLDRQTWVSLQQLVSHDVFEQVLDASRIFYRNIHNQQQTINISDLQSEVNSQKTYHERKQEIEKKSIDNKNKVSRRVRELQ